MMPLQMLSAPVLHCTALTRMEYLSVNWHLEEGPFIQHTGYCRYRHLPPWPSFRPPVYRFVLVNLKTGNSVHRLELLSLPNSALWFTRRQVHRTSKGWDMVRDPGNPELRLMY